MDVDNINNGNSLDSVKVVMPNGVVKEVNPAQQKTVVDLIKFCVDGDGDSEDFALVFSGRKLKPDQQLCQIPSIDKSKKYPMRLMKQRSQPKPKLSPEEITKLLTECRNSYRTLVEDAHPHVAGDANQMLLNYLDRNGGENYKTVLKDFPMLPYDQLGQDAIRDFRLLIQFVMRDNDFAQKHPHCLLIFKRALDQVAAKYSAASPFVRYGPGAGAGPSNRQPQNAAVAQQQQPALVTQHMLSQALAMALGGGGGGGGEAAGAGPENPAAPMEVEQQQAAAQPPPPADEHAAAMELGANNYAVQLQQMHDFGFMDDGENIQALMLTNGDVEQALQIVIAMRE